MKRHPFLYILARHWTPSILPTLLWKIVLFALWPWIPAKVENVVHKWKTISLVTPSCSNKRIWIWWTFSNLCHNMFSLWELILIVEEIIFSYMFYMCMINFHRCVFYVSILLYLTIIGSVSQYFIVYKFIIYFDVRTLCCFFK